MHSFRIVFLGLLMSVGCGNEPTNVADRGLVIRTVSEDDLTRVAPGVNVQVNDQPWQITDGEGEAVFEPAAPPYTLRVHQSGVDPVGQPNETLWVVQRSEPSLEIYPVEGSSYGLRKVVIEGRITGRIGGAESTILVEHDEPVHYGGTTAGPDGSFELEYTWQGPTNRRVVLHALELEQDREVDIYGRLPLPVRYLGYGSASLVIDGPVQDLDDNEDLRPRVTGVNISLSSVREEEITGAFDVPAGLAPNRFRTALYLFFPGFDVYLGEDELPPTARTYTHTVPAIPGLEAWVFIDPATPLSTSLWRRVWPIESETSTEFILPPEVIEPEDDASISLETPFRWRVLGQPRRQALEAICDPGGRNIHIRAIEATDGEARLPTFPSLDLAPSPTACLWQIDWESEDAPNSRRTASSDWRRVVIE